MSKVKAHKITAAMLYDFVRCPHRVYLDLFGDPIKRDEISAFVKMLWDRGHAFEKEVIEGLKIPFTDLMSQTGTEAVTHQITDETSLA